MPYYVELKPFHSKAHVSASKVNEWEKNMKKRKKNKKEEKKLMAHDHMEYSSPNPHLSGRMVLQDIVGFLH